MSGEDLIKPPPDHPMLFTHLFTLLLSRDETENQFGIIVSDSPAGCAARCGTCAGWPRPPTSDRSSTGSPAAAADPPPPPRNGARRLREVELPGDAEPVVHPAEAAAEAVV